MDVKWYLIVVLIFISLMTSVIRASFHVLIYIHFLEKYLFKPFVHFYNCSVAVVDFELQDFSMCSRYQSVIRYTT